MEIFCQNCRKRVGKIADEKIPVGQRASVKCPQCGEKIFLTRPNPEVAPGITPGASNAASPKPPPPGVEIPGQTSGSASASASGPGVSPGPTSMNPDYDFTIGKIIGEAWRKTKGVKGPIWGALLAVFLLFIGAGMVIGVLARMLGGHGNEVALGAALQLTLTIAIYPFIAGIMMIGIRRSVDLPITWKLSFAYFSFLLPIVIAIFLTWIFTSLGFILLIIPGIYLSIAYTLTLPLIVDKGLGPWQAMEASRRAVSKHWFKVFGLYLVMFLIYLVSVIPLGLGLIWAIPMFFVVNGILYREIFGVSESA